MDAPAACELIGQEEQVVDGRPESMGDVIDALVVDIGDHDRGILFGTWSIDDQTLEQPVRSARTCVGVA